ncbi:T9SS type B sorting domain-containing protein [Spirosoma lituiforme]
MSKSLTMLLDYHKLKRVSRLWLKVLHGGTGLLIYSVYACCQPVFAQFCANPSGPLLINQTFGTASQPISMAGLTPYQYVPPTCPSDGQYTVTETIDGGCFNYTWYAVPTDHTPDDVDGNMMIVNGANTAGAFYQQTVSGLCPGTTYELSLWALNLLKTGICPTPLVPNLMLTLETKSGTILSSVPIGSINLNDRPVWLQHTALFNAPPTTEDVILKLVNTKGDYGCGNDMVVDDIQVRQCEDCVSSQVYVPDIFTPNNDGQNDDLTFFMPKVSSYDLKVYNRWGSVIFASTNVNQKWDGTYGGSPCASGDYTWTIAYRPEGTSRNQREHVQTGHVLLVR